MAITKLILWTGEKHSGKTTSAFKLVEIVRDEGFTVAGLLAPSIYEDGRLAGFDAFDLRSGKRVPLARYESCRCEACEAGRGNLKRPAKRDCGVSHLGDFASVFVKATTDESLAMTYVPQFIGGLIFGYMSLRPENTKSADLIIVDEFGPLELDQRGWRKDVDSLLASSNAIILLVVRRELVDLVKQLYQDVPCMELAAGEPDSVNRIITILKARQKKGIETLTG